ncbi:3-deoxy-manno-octulosonate cytidylyltransferase [Simiduia sp. 21SJ11W-1]|uniref:3-deoxy-manno-octulosonate cytidylyltransferase n=1 Tax=Simiduia sp. 21SJ11W-1 TaxID=2909669 RepID=UPI00209D6FC5|nr:3-deoxy-manno-octulosonate cytidylyltransferase [Simiduia sp. 21SJ11W-1]UTA49440.1 3-deoxy-manno-octulosonate cytidylyltransferase [Simiduia sp. 21SJ11W-1]
MSYTVIIPARFGSSRLPGKPLADIGGKTMIERVVAAASLSGAQRVVVATDDERIREHLQAKGIAVCMTRVDHASGTDRLQEVAQQLKLADSDIVVNVQGDEPLIPPAVIDQVASNLANAKAASVATLCEAIVKPEDLFNPNVVKVVADHEGLALYFSRAPMPWARDAFAARGTDFHGELPAAPFARHIGIYAYKVGLLNQFVQWPQAPLEQVESLEQLRVLHFGHRIHVAEACEPVPGGVDTPEDLARLRKLLG